MVRSEGVEGEGVNGVDEGGWRELGQERSCLCVQPLVRWLWLLLLLLGGGGGGGGGEEGGREEGKEGGGRESVALYMYRRSLHNRGKGRERGSGLVGGAYTW